jgi:hypothetical protein
MNPMPRELLKQVSVQVSVAKLGAALFKRGAKQMDVSNGRW